MSLTSGAWGILGGTFDPIHFAHLAIAEQARETLDLAGVLFVPAGVPPHKPGQVVSASADRVAMVELAITDNPSFRVSRVEVERPGPSYAADTVEALLRDPPCPWDPGSGLVFILSVEALAGLDRWHDPERLLRTCRLAVVPRRGHPVPARDWMAAHFPAFVDRLIVLDGPDLGHSASAIRQRASEGLTIRYLVPRPVESYIHEHGLYRRGTQAADSHGRPPDGHVP
jgi:nicotinate-nucleotide adenylyltransferase